MFFCPKCSYSLDLKKSSLIGNKQVIVSTKKIQVKSVASGINKVIKENINPSEIKPTFSKEQMLKNKNYIKLSIQEKNKMLEIFNQIGGASGAMFLCNNCNWKKEINNTIKLYSFNTQENVKKISPNEYVMIYNNPILSRTKDYSCKNKDCISHKNFDKKEAVFFHDNNSLQVKYICGACYSSWNT